MKLVKFSTLLIIIIGFGQNMFGQHWDRVVNLRGSWKFSIGDDMNWSKPDYDDREWESIKVPSMWEDQGYNDYDGYAWYRKHFKIYSSVGGNYLTLNLGRIDDVDQVYINGNLIGGSGVFPPHYKTAYAAWRVYYLPKNILKLNNDNIIAVRVYDSQLGGGIVEGDPGIYEKENTLRLDVELDGMWKFKTGDNLSWKDPRFEDQKWANIFVPAFWETQGYTDYNGFAWYRKSFYANDDLAKKRLVLAMGRIDDIDEVYLNGKLIGSTGDMTDEPISFNEHGEYEKFRGYYIPDGAIEANKENPIAVRVYDGYNVGGIYDGPVGIITQDRYAKFWKEQRKYTNKNNFWKWLFD